MTVTINTVVRTSNSSPIKFSLSLCKVLYLVCCSLSGLNGFVLDFYWLPLGSLGDRIAGTVLLA